MTATTVDEARWLEARGVDAVSHQGLEAGDHRGIVLSDDLDTEVGTFAIVPPVARAVKIPVIDAGGISDARGVASLLRLGAAEVPALLAPELAAEFEKARRERS